MERKVIIRGHVFDYADKEPFLRSGQSIFGAIEYDAISETVKCHECGEWRENIGNHLKFCGGSAKEYKDRHGLCRTSGLLSPGASERRAAISTKQHKKRVLEHRGIATPTAEKKAGGWYKKFTGRTLQYGEQMNLRARCRAQLLFQIQLLAAKLGYTPSTNELNAAGISHKAIQVRFGSVNQGIRQAGLEERRAVYSHDLAPKLPPGFPDEKELRESRMPWPKEYFGLRPLERKSLIDSKAS